MENKKNETRTTLTLNTKNNADSNSQAENKKQIKANEKRASQTPNKEHLTANMPFTINIY